MAGNNKSSDDVIKAGISKTADIDDVGESSFGTNPVGSPCQDCNSGPVGEPGFWEGLIPVWGSGRAAVNDFQNGRWGWGLFNSALAVTDVFLVKALATGAVKLAGKLVAKEAVEVAGKEGAEILAKEAGEKALGEAGEGTAKFANDARLQDHFQRHGGDFGAKSATEYEKQASKFLSGESAGGTLEKVRPNGDVVRYNPATEEFGVISKEGAVRTYYKPDPAVHGFPTNMDYFNAQ